MRPAVRLHLAVGAGAGVGAVLRYLAAVAVVATGAPEPLATVVVNIAGSFIIGLFAGLTGPGGRLSVGPDTRAFVMAGLCGGLTTFSTMNLETLLLLLGGTAPLAMGYLATTIALSLASVWAGHRLAPRRA